MTSSPFPSPALQGFGYFQNVGSTRRQGIEAEASLKSNALQLYASYAFIDARFLDALQVGSNSPFADGDGNVQIVAGQPDPAHSRAIASRPDSTMPSPTRSRSAATRCMSSSQYFVGDDPTRRRSCRLRRLQPAASYQINKNLQLYGKVDNLFDNRYATYGTFFDTAALPNFANGGARSPIRARSARRVRARSTRV